MKMAVTQMVCLSMLLAGCMIVPAPTHQRDLFVQTIPKCWSEKECEVKWAAARRWVLNNAGYKFQHVTNDYIETFNALDSSAQLAARVVKEPLPASQGYTITIELSCGKHYRCTPDLWDAALDFNRTVEAAWTMPSSRDTSSQPQLVSHPPSVPVASPQPLGPAQAEQQPTLAPQPAVSPQAEHTTKVVQLLRQYRGAPLFSAPDTASEKLGSVDAGIQLKALEESKTWVYIETPRGQQGWIMKEWLRK